VNRGFYCIAAFLWGCFAVPGPTVALGAPPEVLPDIAGWSVVREPVVYDASSLWEAIDGAADLFVSYAVVDMHMAYYSRTGGPEVRAEVYLHSSPETAFGIFSQERSTENTHVNIGTAAVLGEGMLNILCGSYYVKLSTNTPGESTSRDLSIIGSAVAKHLAQPADLPRMLAVLPAQGRIPNSEQFIADSYLGYGFLRNVYSARYGATGKCEVFLIAHGNAEQASQTLKAYERVAAPVPAGASGPGHSRVRDQHNGLVDLVLRGRMLGGIRGCPDSVLCSTLFRELEDRIDAAAR
jgi:hypothetical protein